MGKLWCICRWARAWARFSLRCKRDSLDRLPAMRSALKGAMIRQRAHARGLRSRVAMQMAEVKRSHTDKTRERDELVDIWFCLRMEGLRVSREQHKSINAPDALKTLPRDSC